MAATPAFAAASTDISFAQDEPFVVKNNLGDVAPIQNYFDAKMGVK